MLAANRELAFYLVRLTVMDTEQNAISVYWTVNLDHGTHIVCIYSDPQRMSLATETTGIVFVNDDTFREKYSVLLLGYPRARRAIGCSF